MTDSKTGNRILKIGNMIHLTLRLHSYPRGALSIGTRGIRFGKRFLALMVILSTNAYAQQASSLNCGSLDTGEDGYGPFDYANPVHRQEHLPIVEAYHLNNDVYELRRGMTAESPLGDLEYTLRTFPNHHFALEAIARLHRQENTKKLPTGRYSLDCWFERARGFNPTDGMVPMIYGTHLFQLRQYDEAEEFLLEAARLLPELPEAHYNLGLLYVQLGDLAAAHEYAEKAYAMNFPLPGLREQLKRRGAWPAGN